MAESLQEHHESHESEEQLDNQPIEASPEAPAESKTTSPEAEAAPPIEALQEEVKKKAAETEDVKIDQAPEKHAVHSLKANKELKDEAFQRTLNRTRKRLSSPNRALSKVVHQPVIDAISKVGEKTISRPTGIVTGALVALAGSSYILYTAKHYGFSYNYLVVFLLFIGGYLIGLVIEFLIYSLRRLSSHK